MTTVRKAVTIVLSFLVFRKPFSIEWVLFSPWNFVDCVFVEALISCTVKISRLVEKNSNICTCSGLIAIEGNPRFLFNLLTEAEFPDSCFSHRVVFSQVRLVWLLGGGWDIPPLLRQKQAFQDQTRLWVRGRGASDCLSYLTRSFLSQLYPNRYFYVIVFIVPELME